MEEQEQAEAQVTLYPGHEVKLNAHDFATKQEMHAYLARELAFPDYYGANLDALADCLSEICVPVTIRICRTWRQPGWFRAAAGVIRQSAKENPYLTVK